jgi:hypothetical protein
MAQQLREKIDKWDCISKKLLHNKRNGHQIEEAATEWEKTFASYTSNKRLITRIHMEFKKLKPPKNQ